jgi:molybdenum cofactor synthesis domain-containing protein
LSFLALKQKAKTSHRFVENLLPPYFFSFLYKRAVRVIISSFQVEHYFSRKQLSMAGQVEIICIGNELLIGKIVNTNAQWLAKRVTTLGLSINRVTIVGDQVNEISTVLRETLSRKPQFILTTGGLGPTFDDKTLTGIAEALKKSLEVNHKALSMVKEKYRRLLEEGKIESIELTPPRVKMATLPAKSEPLPNPIGTAPGVLAKHGACTIVALPGVPSEMEAIFDISVAPLIKKAAGNNTFFETSLEVDGIMESDMAPLIDKTMHDNPYVYIKSHPSRTGEGTPHLELHLSTTAEDISTAKNRVTKTLTQITDLAQMKGGEIRISKTK